jgi:hypothetical protein
MDHDDENVNDLIFGQASYSVMWIGAGTEFLMDAFKTEEEAVAWAQEEYDDEGGHARYEIRKHTIAVVKVIGEV